MRSKFTWFHNQAGSLDPKSVVGRRPRLGKKQPDMMKTGELDHPSFQQMAFMDQETGECGERRANHRDQEAEKFYRERKQRAGSVRVGMEAPGDARWFERLPAELGF